MLIINKILSKKIQFPLSLRGLFPFCHSREGGNPSPQSLRSYQSNLSGFSLIELMVAIAILAMAIFGIFHAYSVGFMGMADARDRTVATNYMREAMEDIKNMDFDKIKSTYKSFISSNKKFKIYVTVSKEITNLKEIFTIVEWEDRNGIKKTVESSMLVHFIEVFALDPAKIVLYADSYAVLNSGGTTVLTAVIKDIKGNTIIDWGEKEEEGNISFSKIFGEELGDLSEIDVIPINGIAKTSFSSNGSLTEDVGYTEIETSVTLPNGTVVTDSVIIKVTDGPVKITLTADPPIIKSNSIECSTITVSLQNAVGVIIKKNVLLSDVEITFSVFGDFAEGDISYSNIITIPVGGSEEDAIGTMSLCPISKRGLATVIATATDLESGRADVKFLGQPVSILISANPTSIYVDDPEGSTITVGLIDKNGFLTSPISGDITISLELSTNPEDLSAELGTYSLNFNSDDEINTVKTTNFINQTSKCTAIITASASEEVGLSEASVTINVISALVPDHIELKANHSIVQAGGTSTITATVYDGSKIVTNYNGIITFTNTGDGTFISDNPATADKGIATIEVSYNNPGTATIDASLLYNSNLIESIESVVVGFYGGADHIKLTANPKYVNLGSGNTSIITATVCDLNKIIVLNYNGIITFTNTGDGTFISDNPATADKGIATIVLSCSEVGGIAIITASDGVIYSNSETIEFYEEATIKLVEDSAKYYPADLKVDFEVTAIGKDILVEGMGISWEDDGSRLKEIVIGSDVVYTGNSLSGVNLDITDTILSDGVNYLVELTFGKDMAGKIFTVNFYTSIGMFTLEGIAPIPQATP